MPRKVTLALLAALLLAPAGSILAADTRVEEIMRRQDEMMDNNQRVEVVANAKAEVELTKSAAAHYLLGRAYGLVGELEKAREQFDWSIEKNPAFAYPYYGLGVYFMMKNNLEEAERHFNQSLKLDPELMRAHSQLGKLYVGMQDLAGAEREFKIVIGKEPANREVRTLLGHLYLKQKRFDRAITEFRTVLDRYPQDPAALKGHALALGFDHKTDESILAFEKYLKVEPKDLEGYLFLKNLYLEKGDQENAIKALKRLQEHAPEGSPIQAEAEREIERIKAGGSGRKQVTIEGLIELLDSEDLAERREAMKFLAELKIHPPPRKIVEKVSNKYESDPLIRVMAVGNLGAVGGANAVSLLQVIILHPKDGDPDEKVRAAAAAALGAIETDAAIPVLLETLDDPSFYVFRVAIQSLREYSGMYFLDDPDTPIPEDMREELTGKWRDWWKGGRAFTAKLKAIEAIQELKFRRFAQYLVPLLADGEKMVAEKARNAFFIVTAVQVGTPADLNTEEGRAKLAREALKVLEDRKKASPDPKKAPADKK